MNVRNDQADVLRQKGAARRVRGDRAAVRALLCVALALAACQGRSDPPPTPASAEAPPARLEGKVRVADRWVDVAPTVLHDAKMDLATRCRLHQGDARGRGADLPLCFSTTRREPAAIKTIRVERDAGMPQVMQRLTRDTEGAHFVIDRSGGTYQILDLAFAARRGGDYPADEIRVITCNADAERALVGALQRIYPAAQVTVAPAPAVPAQGAPP